MSLSPDVVGRIIFAKFLSLSLKRYENEINKVEGSGMFRALFPDMIAFKMFPQARMASDKEGFPPNTLGRVEEDEGTFYIWYRFPGFAGEYSLDREKLAKQAGSGKFPWFRKEEFDLLERKLRLVSSRNRVTHMTLLGIIEHQTAYLRSCDPLELVPLSQMRISHWVRGRGYQSIDNSVISRVVNNTSILMPDGKPMPLKHFFPSSREICKRHIKGILGMEQMELKSNRLDRPYTDEEIRVRLKKVYSLNISRRTISYCRNQMGIPPFHERTYDNQYPPRWAQFSAHFPATLPSVRENVPEMPGIYELSLENADIEYPLKTTGVFYIGSSKNIRKRLRAHLGGQSKNGDLNVLISGGKCFLQVSCLQRWVQGEGKGVAPMF